MGSKASGWKTPHGLVLLHLLCRAPTLANTQTKVSGTSARLSFLSLQGRDEAAACLAAIFNNKMLETLNTATVPPKAPCSQIFISGARAGL